MIFLTYPTITCVDASSFQKKIKYTICVGRAGAKRADKLTTQLLENTNFNEYSNYNDNLTNEIDEYDINREVLFHWSPKEALHLLIAWNATSKLPDQSEAVHWRNIARYCQRQFHLKHSENALRENRKTVTRDFQKWNGSCKLMEERYITGN